MGKAALHDIYSPAVTQALKSELMLFDKKLLGVIKLDRDVRSKTLLWSGNTHQLTSGWMFLFTCSIACFRSKLRFSACCVTQRADGFR